MFGTERFGVGPFGGGAFGSGAFGEGGGGVQTVLEQIQSFGNLTFFKDYSALPVGTVTATQLNADSSVGDATATYTSARSASAPATYVDASGVVQLVTTANVGRIQGGFYDATGFHTEDSNGKTAKGLMIEAAGTNLITKSNNVEDAIFTKTNVTADNDDAGSSSPDGTATAPSLTATDTDGTFLLASAVTAATYSVFIKRKTGTGTISITANGGTGYSAVTVTSEWARFSVTVASASQTCGIKIGTSGDAIYVWTNQFENVVEMTSPIPTTAAALTRPSDVLEYTIAGNRTAASESVFNGFIPFNTFANDGLDKYLSSTDTKERRIYKVASIAFVRNYSNVSDSSASQSDTTSTAQANVSHVVTAVFKHSSPYSEIYFDGVSEGSDVADDFIDPVWGTNFDVGNRGGANHIRGVVKNVTIYSDAKSAANVSSITTILHT